MPVLPEAVRTLVSTPGWANKLWQSDAGSCDMHIPCVATQMKGRGDGLHPEALSLVMIFVLLLLPQ